MKNINKQEELVSAFNPMTSIIKNITPLTNEIDRLLERSMVESMRNDYGLEEVMMAIEKSDLGDDEPYFTNEGQIVYYQPEEGNINLTGIFWDMGKPLSLQSPETVEKIAEILNEAQT